MIFAAALGDWMLIVGLPIYAYSLPESTLATNVVGLLNVAAGVLALLLFRSSPVNLAVPHETKLA